MQILKIFLYFIVFYNGRQNLKEPYTKKYQKLIACSYDYE